MTVYLLLGSFDKRLEALGLDWICSAGDILLAFILAGAASGLANRLARAAVKHRAGRIAAGGSASRRMETGISIAASVTKYVFYFIAAAVSIGELGLSGAMNSMLAAAGIGTLVLGIGAQHIIGDVAAGLFMLFENQLDVGDYVRVAETEGIVENITLRTVSIRGWKGEKHTIPNGQIKSVTNYSRGDYTAVVEIDIAREEDADRALDIMMEEMRGLYGELKDGNNVKEPERVGITGVRDAGVTVRAAMAADVMQQWYIQREAIRRIRRRFAAEGIASPADRLILEERARRNGD